MTNEELGALIRDIEFKNPQTGLFSQAAVKVLIAKGVLTIDELRDQLKLDAEEWNVPQNASA